MIELHFWAALVFAGFILTDRLILRPVYTAQQLRALYERARLVAGLAALVLIVSGFFLWQPDRWPKVLLGLATITLFFFCPTVSRFLGDQARQLYRAGVLLLLIATLLASRV